MSTPDLSQLPKIALVKDEPIFNEPWEAQAFAMVINLHAKGNFEWSEWADTLSGEIHSGKDRSYYEHWLVALEKIVAAKNLTTADALDQRRKAWHDAAADTPHGDPIVLKASAITNDF